MLGGDVGEFAIAYVICIKICLHCTVVESPMANMQSQCSQCTVWQLAEIDSPVAQLLLHDLTSFQHRFLCALGQVLIIIHEGGS